MLVEENIHRVSRQRRPHLATGEILLVLLTGLWLVIACWWKGSVAFASQPYLLAVAAAALLIALVGPYGYPFVPRVRIKRLLSFPVFWLGVVFLAYVGIQWANPDRMVFEFDGYKGAVYKDLRNFSEEDVAQMSREEFRELPGFSTIKGLPTSVYASVEDYSPIRFMIATGSVWLLICALWVGITRRRSLHMLLFIANWNILILALVAIFQILNRSELIIGVWESPVSSFVGTFVNRGLGAAYMNCGIIISLGMFFHYGKVKKSAEASGFTLIYMISALVMTVGVLVSSSRMGIVCCSVLWGIFLVVFIYDWVSQRWTSPAKLGTCILGGMTIIFIITVFGTDHFQPSFKRFEHLDDMSVEARIAQNRSTWEMIADRPWTGWGAGSYPWIFPDYLQNNPELLPKNKRQRFRYTHAHNDILQPFSELGILGMLPILGIFGVWGWQMLQSYRYLDKGLVLMTLGSFVFLAHAFTDPLFHSTAILGMWGIALLAPAFAARLMRSRNITQSIPISTS